MYRAGRHSIRERIIAAEVMKLERQQAARRGAYRAPLPDHSRSRSSAAHSGKHPLW
jgi:hypothetical protein